VGGQQDPDFGCHCEGIGEAGVREEGTRHDNETLRIGQDKCNPHCVVLKTFASWHCKGRAHRCSLWLLPIWAFCPGAWHCSSICFTQGWPNTVAPSSGQAAGGLWVLLLLAGAIEGCRGLGHHEGRVQQIGASQGEGTQGFA